MTEQNLYAEENHLTIKRPLVQKILVVAAIMTTIGGTLTGIMTFANVGLSKTFIHDWLSSFVFALVVVMPSGFVLMMIINKLADTLFSAANKTQRNIIVGISMAFVMESIMSAVTAANNIGLTDISIFINAWFRGFIIALPLGLVISIVMAISLKPKLERFMAS